MKFMQIPAIESALAVSIAAVWHPSSQQVRCRYRCSKQLFADDDIWLTYSTCGLAEPQR